MSGGLGLSALSKKIGAIILMVFAMTSLARAELVIDITQGNVKPLPIAISDFAGQSETTNIIGQRIADVVRADLERSGLFKIISKNAFLQQISDIQAIPVFSNWRKISAQALTNGIVTSLPDGRLEIQFRLWDVVSEQYLVGHKLSTQPTNWRRLGHKVADYIYERLTGESGYFDTRVVYVSESGPANRRVKRLAIMDQDGARHQFLTDGSNLVLTPRFSPSQQVITYLSYFNNRPRVYLLDIDTGQQEVLGEFPGMTFAPRFSPSGNQVVMSMADNGNSDIYIMDLRTRAVKRLTKHPGIDTAPSFSPDGSQITFESDRGGRQQLYVMNVDGSNQKRISFGRGNYGTPVWSPRGDLIAFTKLTGGKFSIGVMRTNGSQERILTEGFHNEGPSWAPNGRVLVFFRQIPGKNEKDPDKVRLWSIDLTGYNEREIISPRDGSDPAWSPLIPDGR
ncbi:Tol-Pal system protein TolB [Sneathiella sp. P13V-1]|uniref:Tol-Pal system beta propeller repeat protein TolB n=1 Tax=Sneathiella sp. P13V-1 TaxID=2697366 RepID=UPI00187BAC36|nr:Tol-Pal system beta propeller repeat protein TolB [Sneathiella sp. P13V-1]MBE7637968.1 Tol-Pal system protein TolB [Sneathiella sp. P13V-1]